MTPTTSSPPSDADIEHHKRQRQIDELVLKKAHEQGREMDIEYIRQELDRQLRRIIREIYNTKSEGNP